jgi:hypothetical protein
LLSQNLGQKSRQKLIFDTSFFEIQFFKNNAYLIDIILFAKVCVLFFLLSPKTILKTSVKTTENRHEMRDMRQER